MAEEASSESPPNSSCQTEESSRPTSKRKPGDFSFMNYMKSDPRFKRFCPYKVDKNNYENANDESRSGSNDDGNHFIAIPTTIEDAVGESDKAQSPPAPQKIKPLLLTPGVNGDSSKPDEDTSMSDEEDVNATDEEANASDEEVNATDEEVNATDEEVNATDEEVNATDEEVNATDEEIIAVDEKVNVADEDVNATDEKVKTADEVVKTAVEEVKTADEEVKTTDEEVKTTDEEVKTVDDCKKTIYEMRQACISKNEMILHQFLYGEPSEPAEDNDNHSDSDSAKPKSHKEKDGEFEEGEYERDDEDGEVESYGYSLSADAGALQDSDRRKIEFDVLDDLNEEEDDDDEDESSCNDGWDDSDNADEVPEEEIDAMLDQTLEESRKRRRDRYENEEQAHEEREKVVLKARGNDHFEVLPEGWIEVTHNSGMPIYLHKPTRVCTLSKPYFLGPGSARKHQVPVTAIPCLHYRRELDKEQEKKVNGAAEATSSVQHDEQANHEVPKAGQGLPSAKIETVQENFKEKSIDHVELRDYCQKLFEFKTITVRRFKTWAGRRKHQQRIKQMHRPTLPSGTKLITCPLPPSNDRDENGNGNPRRAEFVMNPNGKSYVCILHEYVQHAMKVQPRYTFRELENASTPYGATVVINDMEYGSGFGSSKKYAKLHAAKATLEILIPQMKNINPDDKAQGIQQDLSFFDEVRVVDPRVSELCAKAGQPSPYQILLECLKRLFLRTMLHTPANPSNYGMGDTQIKFETQTLKHQKNEFTMTVGKHVAKVICKNKRDGKQRASQSILQAMHPHIPSWGSLLRLYGKGSCKTLKEKKQEEQQITELQCRTTANKPNQLILDKLRDELLKLKRNKELMKPIGKFVSTDVEPPSLSGCNLKNVDL